MQRKIDAILGRIKEPETLRSVGDLNLVKRVRYSPSLHAFEVFLDVNTAGSSCFVCGVVTANIQRTIERELQEAFERDFPGCRITFS